MAAQNARIKTFDFAAMDHGVPTPIGGGLEGRTGLVEVAGNCSSVCSLADFEIGMNPVGSRCLPRSFPYLGTGEQIVSYLRLRCC